jgi:hypothetical protein
MGEQHHAIIPLNGGLDLVSTHYNIQSQPGTAKVMTNFEPSIEAGYRRINGYLKLGTTQPSGAADPILGVAPYADGVVAVASTGVYFSTDGTTWTQVNRDTYVAQTGTVSVTDAGSGYVVVTGSGTAFTTEYSVGDHIRISGNIRQIATITSNTAMTIETAITGGVTAGTAHYKNGDTTPTGTLSARTSQGRAQFAWYPADGEHGSLVISDSTGNNDLGYFKITDPGAGRTYFWDDVDTAGFAAPDRPKYICQFEERIVVANDADDMGNITWSERLSNRRFDGASAGTVQLDAPILRVIPLRDKVIIFTRNSIHQLINLDDPNQLNIALLPISYKVGTVSGWSVQEVGGDLIFLSNNGMRTLSTSDQYGDVQLSTISRKIDPIIKDLLQNINGYDISSAFYNFKNQYRLFYTKSTFSNDNQVGLVGTLKQGQQGEMEWQWSQIVGIPVGCLGQVPNEDQDADDYDKFYHGGYDGYIYKHDTGNSFDGGNINAVLELNELDYGDIGRRKTIHYIKIFGDIEADAVDIIDMELKYDFESANTMQPGVYQLESIGQLSLYGTAVYGTDLYGGIADFSTRVLVNGSGFINKFVFNSTGTGGVYNLNSIYVDMRLGPLQ